MSSTGRERLKILITVKTYPIPSKKYGELVCTAGIRDTGEFVRLYPVNFRDQSYGKQYQKYQWIEIEAEKHTGRDSRKESYRPFCDTLQLLGEPIGSGKGDWAERASIVLPAASQSIEDLRERQENDRTSLGLVRPKQVIDMTVEEDDREWKRSFLEELKQQRIWEDRTVSKQPPRKVSYRFKYRFKCDDPRCNGHKMMNKDWELGALYWKLIDQGESETATCEKVRSKFVDQICGQDRDTYFFVGTTLEYPKSWLVIGTFWPQKTRDQKTGQQSLFDQ